MNLPWLIVTSDATRHIVPAQVYLFGKYLPEVEPQYIDLRSENVGVWCTNVLDKLPPVDYCVFGLDDYLPTGQIDMVQLARAFEILKRDKLDRWELGFSAPRKKPLDDRGEYLCTTATTSYSVSAQFAIWDMKKLRETLNAHGTPWHWEVKGECICGCFRRPVFTWLESSALSGKRWPGETNVIGMPPGDVKELEVLRLIHPPYKKIVNAN